ncbi:succinate dehydrogenase / fumarate reductase cytochrome b subunit [Mucilaginibacter gracilis]|uniref:Succinate dehydrogenase / fumarate reductase cytochrome b subunit n=1 Tax=Mucilaginibacter gracilis TaxID=423350 RepID=A0A495ITK1_9SPHI|nr:succinate dehydrogenase cytochrome b subunit [Mucilaginibacter gracilis]RKR80105.1 succinate dehydrogenase / fumarate reductase cytochrome b subunit [Mucilaginibacter gracilis]
MKQTTIQYKLVMAGTGLFLCFFLVIHLLGNLQLLLPADEAKEQFNWYSHLLAGNMLIKIISWVLLISIIAHAIYALVLARKTKKANGTKYVYDKRADASPWNSRNMGLLGTVILTFLVIHLKDFWYVSDFTTMGLDKQGYKDMYTVVVLTFHQWWYVLIYEISFIALGFHLLHGFFSAARTLGLYHPKYVKVVRYVGWLYTAFITGGFMLIPIVVYFNNLSSC